jgi:hypothetical protein
MNIAVTKDPKKNRLINPTFNRMINPTFNRMINPTFNRMINPTFNRMINPTFNRMINPTFNRMINPKYNRMINPKFNRGFSGYYYFNLSNELIEFAIIENDILHFYNEDGETTRFGVKHSNQGFVIFDNEKKYIGHLESNSSDGYNYYNLNEEWKGYLQ